MSSSTMTTMTTTTTRPSSSRPRHGSFRLFVAALAAAASSSLIPTAEGSIVSEASAAVRVGHTPRTRRVTATTGSVVATQGGDDTTIAYSTPDSSTWPSFQTWQDELASQLSLGASLFGPYFENDDDTTVFDRCEAKAGTNPFERVYGNNGLCMQGPMCYYQYCRPDVVGETVDRLQAPAYVLDPRTAEDISMALQFAGRHGIPVSVKNTGHSAITASLAANSLLIWMPKFPKDDTVTRNFQDSCQNTTHDAVLGVGGGEIFDDIINAVAERYHVVTGACRTVGVAGWLQGVGLSYTSRHYGLGVDNVVGLQAVLPDGSIVHVDECSNPDLWWAFRGGGGGNFGVVTHMDLKLHPVTPVVYLSWQIQGLYSHRDFLRHTRSWFDFMLTFISDLDSRWAGNWDAIGIDLYFVGTLEDAKTTFLDQFDMWYEQEYLPTVRPGWFWGARRPSSLVIEYDNWYNARGGADAFRDPDFTPSQGTNTEPGFESSRIVTAEFIAQRKDELLDVMVELVDNNELAFYSSYLLGGNILDGDVEASSVHPVMRDAVLLILTSDSTAGRRLRDFIPPEQTGVSYNHHSTLEPNWRESLWGGAERYNQLLAIKDEIDPNRVLNCWHGVGYVGEEIDADTLSVENEPEAQCWLYLFSICIFRTIPWLQWLFFSM